MADSYVEMSIGGSSQEEARRHHPSTSQQQQQQQQQMRGFWNQYRAFTRMAFPYFVEEWKARLLFAIMVILTLLNSGVRVVFSYLVRDFWSALSDSDEENSDDFYRILRKFLIAMSILAPINVLYRYQRQYLAIEWRQWMTERVLKLYFSNRVYYGLERSPHHHHGYLHSDAPIAGKRIHQPGLGGPSAVMIDNPDQRITEDVRSFTEFSLTLFLTLLMSMVDLICFSIILYTIMPELFVAIALFAILGTIATILIGKVLVQLNFEKLQREANFRYSLVRVRDNAESIAFLKGEPVEKGTVQQRLSHVIDNMHSLNAAVRNLEFFTTYYDYVTWILPLVVVAPEYFNGAVELGVVQQSVSAFAHVLDDISIIVTQYESLTEFAAGIDRLYTFLSAAQNLKDPDDSTETSPLVLKATISKPEQVTEPLPQSPSFNTTSINLQHLPRGSRNNSSTLILKNLTLATPNNQRTLIRNLSYSLPRGQNLLIVGESGSGKSSLLRAIAGLWNTGSGSIYAPCLEEVYFLPQRPYCSNRSLRAELLYPMSASSGVEDQQSNQLTDRELFNILKAVHLEELSQRVGLDEVMDFSNTLSLGEQQRLAFGRLLVYRQRLAFGQLLAIMDESTSALDLESERRMYQLLREDNAISYISVGHRPSLGAYHHTKLTISGDSYSIETIQ